MKKHINVTTEGLIIWFRDNFRDGGFDTIAEKRMIPNIKMYLKKMDRAIDSEKNVKIKAKLMNIDILEIALRSLPYNHPLLTTIICMALLNNKKL